MYVDVVYVDVVYTDVVYVDVVYVDVVYVDVVYVDVLHVAVVYVAVVYVAVVNMLSTSKACRVKCTMALFRIVPFYLHSASPPLGTSLCNKHTIASYKKNVWIRGYTGCMAAEPIRKTRIK